MPFVTELKKLGLKDKEASVYLSCLELGPSAAQQISRKSKVVRATTYVILESLMQMGLVTRYKEGKKTLFSAEPPRQLVRLLEKQQEGIEEQKHHLDDILPELQMLTKAEGGKPTVRYFEGKEGLHAIRQEIVREMSQGDTVYNFSPLDHLYAVFADDETKMYQQRAAKGINAKTIFTTRSELYKKRMLAENLSRSTERRFVPPEKFSSTSGMTIYGDKVAIGSFTGKLMGVVIEGSSMSEMMRYLFELAWIAAGSDSGTETDKKR